MEADIWVDTTNSSNCLYSHFAFRYPSAARQHVHVTKAYLPLDIAKALSKERSLVQKAIETFYTRDAVQLRVR